MLTCKLCSHVLEQADHYDEDSRCPKCNGNSWTRTITLAVGNVLNLVDEYGAAVTDEEGTLTAERILKTDRNTSASLSSDPEERPRISIERQTRVPNFVEEGRVAEAFAASYNKRCNSHYSIEAKREEDSDYADRVLQSERDAPDTLNVQIRHLDAHIIAAVGSQGKFSGERTVADLIDAIRSSITTKALVDERLKAETILLLVIPAALGVAIRQGVEGCQIDFQGFKDVWIAPFREECFGLNRF